MERAMRGCFCPAHRAGMQGAVLGACSIILQRDGSQTRSSPSEHPLKKGKKYPWENSELPGKKTFVII